MCVVCVRLDLCAHQKTSAGTLKHGASGFERGQLQHEGGRSATVYRFGENLACAL